MRFVPIKTDDQLDLQGIHRVRDRLICRRTAVINQLRAFLLERGMVFAYRPANLKAAMADILENAEAFGEKLQETTDDAHTPTSARSGRRSSSRNFCGIIVSLLQSEGDGEYHQMC